MIASFEECQALVKLESLLCDLMRGLSKIRTLSEIFAISLFKNLSLRPLVETELR